jgi:ubiquinone/menaquinone biosynthesis C-methylase UbiE
MPHTLVPGTTPATAVAGGERGEIVTIGRSHAVAPKDWHDRIDDVADREVGDSFESAPVARSYPLLYEAPTPVGALFRARLKLVLAVLAAIPGGVLLDAGCGGGQVSRAVLDERRGAFSITALDRSGTMLETARSTIGEEATLVAGRVEELPFDDASFDVALALGVLEYVVDLDTSVSELARVVRPGGVVVVSMQNPYSPYRVWEKAVLPQVMRLKGVSLRYDERAVGERRLVRTLRAAGLEPADVAYYNFNLFPIPFDQRFSAQEMGLAARLAPLGRGHLRRLAADMLVSTRRTAPV